MKEKHIKPLGQQKAVVNRECIVLSDYTKYNQKKKINSFRIHLKSLDE